MTSPRRGRVGGRGATVIGPEGCGCVSGAGDGAFRRDNRVGSGRTGCVEPRDVVMVAPAIGIGEMRGSRRGGATSDALNDILKFLTVGLRRKGCVSGGAGDVRESEKGELMADTLMEICKWLAGGRFLLLGAARGGVGEGVVEDREALEKSLRACWPWPWFWVALGNVSDAADAGAVVREGWLGGRGCVGGGGGDGRSAVGWA